MFVYKTTNLVNGKIYIGQHSTNNLKDNYKGSGKLLKSAILKYGEGNFTTQIIRFSKSRAELNKLEKELIKHYNSRCLDIGYNLHHGGFGGNSCVEVNQYSLNGEFIKKWDSIIEASQELNISTKAIQSCAKGIKPTGGGFIWKRHEDNASCNDIDAYKSKCLKSINQYTLDGKYLKTWDSMVAVERETGISASNISKCCVGYESTYQTGGFAWRYNETHNDCHDIEPVRYKKKRKVCKYSMNGDYIDTYNSISEAAKSVSGITTNISKVCSGKRNHANGFKWAYA